MKVFIVLSLTLIGTKEFLHPTVAARCFFRDFIESQCVTYHAKKMTHADAAQSCHANYGGNLIEIRTTETYVALAELANMSQLKLWFGAKKVAEGEWRWLSDNSSANIPKTMFDRGESNNWGGNEECLQMKPNGKLNDAYCGKRYAFVCIHNVAPQCPSGHFIESQCVTGTDEKMTQADAAQSCAANNDGKLYEVRNEVLFHELGVPLRGTQIKLWVGAKKAANGDWRWLSDNSLATLPKEWFASGEPNNLGGNEECLQMQPNGKLSDADCVETSYFNCLN